MTGIWWCPSCDLPLLTHHCQICGTTAKHPISKDLTPVFKEEMTMLCKLFGFDKYFESPKDYILWNSGANYYCQGKRIATVSVASRKPSVIINENNLSSLISPKRGTSKTRFIERLCSANKTYLDTIEIEARNFIQETVSDYRNCTIIVSFSGGKDSSVVSALVRKALSTGSVLHVMADTTIEAPSTYKYLRAFQRDNIKTPLVILSTGLDFYRVCDLIGPPSRILRWCCTTHKTTPIASFLAALRETDRRVLTFDGIRACESVRRSSYERISKPAKVKGEILASPIQNWRDIDVWSYLLVKGISFNTAYRHGFRRVGCLPCPLNSQWSDFMISIKYPQFTKRWASLLEAHAVKIGHPKPTVFATQGWRSRAGGRGLNHELASLDREICLKDSCTINYTLARPFSETLFEFFRPFGRPCTIYDDGILLKGNVHNKQEGVIAAIKINRLHNTIRISIGPVKNRRLLLQRFERQIRKFQSCILCGGCAGYCEANAIHVNGQYSVSQERCCGCKACVKASCPSVEALTKKGSSESWSICYGSH